MQNVSYFVAVFTVFVLNDYLFTFFGIIFFNGLYLDKSNAEPKTILHVIPMVPAVPV